MNDPKFATESSGITNMVDDHEDSSVVLNTMSSEFIASTSS